MTISKKDLLRLLNHGFHDLAASSITRLFDRKGDKIVDIKNVGGGHWMLMFENGPNEKITTEQAKREIERCLDEKDRTDRKAGSAAPVTNTSKTKK